MPVGWVGWSGCWPVPSLLLCDLLARLHGVHYCRPENIVIPNIESENIWYRVCVCLSISLDTKFASTSDIIYIDWLKKLQLFPQTDIHYQAHLIKSIARNSRCQVVPQQIDVPPSRFFDRRNSCIGVGNWWKKHTYEKKNTYHSLNRFY